MPKVIAYQVGWVLRDHRGFFRVQVEGETQLGRAFPLGNANEAAVVAAILRSDATVWWNGDIGGLACGDRIDEAGEFRNLLSEASRTARDIPIPFRTKGGDGPFPRKQAKRQSGGSKKTSEKRAR